MEHLAEDGAEEHNGGLFTEDPHIINGINDILNFFGDLGDINHVHQNAHDFFVNTPQQVSC